MTTRPIICFTLDSRSGEDMRPRKYFCATMFVAVWRPELGELDALLLEDRAVLAGDERVARLPLDLVERVAAGNREVPADAEPRGHVGDGVRERLFGDHGAVWVRSTDAIVPPKGICVRPPGRAGDLRVEGFPDGARFPLLAGKFYPDGRTPRRAASRALSRFGPGRARLVGGRERGDRARGRLAPPGCAERRRQEQHRARDDEEDVLRVEAPGRASERELDERSEEQEPCDAEEYAPGQPDHRGREEGRPPEQHAGAEERGGPWRHAEERAVERGQRAVSPRLQQERTRVAVGGVPVALERSAERLASPRARGLDDGLRRPRREDPDQDEPRGVLELVGEGGRLPAEAAKRVGVDAQPGLPEPAGKSGASGGQAEHGRSDRSRPAGGTDRPLPVDLCLEDLVAVAETARELPEDARRDHAPGGEDEDGVGLTVAREGVLDPDADGLVPALMEAVLADEHRRAGRAGPLDSGVVAVVRNDDDLDELARVVGRERARHRPGDGLLLVARWNDDGEGRVCVGGLRRAPTAEPEKRDAEEVEVDRNKVRGEGRPDRRAGDHQCEVHQTGSRWARGATDLASAPAAFRLSGEPATGTLEVVLQNFVAFLGVGALVIVTPGPDTALTIRNTLLGDRRGGVFTAWGVASGQAVWTVATSAGVVTILLASETLFSAVKLAGAAYLVFLGLQALWTAWRSPGWSVEPEGRRGGARLSGRVAYRQGLVSNLGNPKMAVFFTSLLPQFAPGGGASFAGLLAFGLVFCLMTFVWLAVYSVAVAKAGNVLRRPRVRRTIEAVTGTVLVALGLRVASEQR